MNINITLFAQVIAFVVMIWLVNRLLWGPLVKALENRRKQIADGLAAAEKGKQDLLSAEDRARKIEDEARRKGAEILSNAEKRAGEIVEEAKVKANEEGERIRNTAQSEITQQMDQAKETLRRQVAGLAVLGAEKILRREVSAETHKDTLDELSRQL